MTKTFNKIEKLPNRKEVYKYGFNQGFGRCLKFIIAFLREKETPQEVQNEIRQYVLKRKHISGKKHELEV